MRASVIHATLFFSLVLFMTIVSGCGNMQLKREMKKIMKHTFVIPEQILEVREGMVSAFSKQDSAVYTMLVFYGPQECSECRINNLHDLQFLYEAAAENSMFEVVTLFAPETEESAAVLQLLLERHWQYPLYLDSNGEFLLSNPDFPDEEIFQSMLLSPDGRPVLIGNPVYNAALWNVFREIVGKLE